MIRAILVPILALLAAGPAAAQGYDVLSEPAPGFAQPSPETEITFPEDHGAHPDFRIEWWYVTSNLEDAAGAPLGVQFTLFRAARAPGDRETGWDSRQTWFAHAAVTTPEIHAHAERFARGGVGQAGVTMGPDGEGPFRAWIDDWEMAGTDPHAPFAPLRLRAAGDGFAYDLALEAEGPMVLQGEAGYSQKSERGQASHYVSQPFFSVEGSVTLDGERRQVRGRAWMDREWSSQPLAEDQPGWDWLSLHLATGEKLMVYRLRQEDGDHYVTGNWITPDGTSARLAPGTIAMEPARAAEVAGREIPVDWRVEIPSRGLSIRTRAMNDRAWNATTFSYWEGPVTAEGSHAAVGYLEMTGY